MIDTNGLLVGNNRVGIAILISALCGGILNARTVSSFGSTARNAYVRTAIRKRHGVASVVNVNPPVTIFGTMGYIDARRGHVILSHCQCCALLQRFSISHWCFDICSLDLASTGYSLPKDHESNAL